MHNRQIPYWSVHFPLALHVTETLKSAKDRYYYCYYYST